jgi:NAD(P)-dependent dehydrogenase (short-subunit alcohol dehydrogenase family)
MTSAKIIALITGAGKATGIGFETARQLAQQGIKVILTARNGADADGLAAILVAEGLDVSGLTLDYGHLDILINNAAGMAPYGERAADADLAIARQVLDVTLFGAWQLTQSLLPLIRKSNHPRIVNVSSGAGSHGDAAFGLTTANSMGTSYAVAKAALNALTVKFANEEKDILVNAVCPGFTATFEGGEAMGARNVKEGAASVVFAALLADDGPSGGFFRDGKALPW